MVCIDELNYEILLSKSTYKDCSKFIRSKYKETYIVEPGFKIFNAFIIGVPPIYVAVLDDTVVFPYTKPCYGTFVLSIENAEAALKLRNMSKSA
ncbi:MAG: DUF1894 domain-containing protein [Nitrospirae bacterium]|nr:DUF1894 domain-containing protein [Nitrospirota bacterium]